MDFLGDQYCSASSGVVNSKETVSWFSDQDVCVGKIESYGKDGSFQLPESLRTKEKPSPMIC